MLRLKNPNSMASSENRTQKKSHSQHMNCNTGALVTSSAHLRNVDKAYVLIYIFYVKKTVVGKI